MDRDIIVYLHTPLDDLNYHVIDISLPLPCTTQFSLKENVAMSLYGRDFLRQAHNLLRVDDGNNDDDDDDDRVPPLTVTPSPS